MKISLLTIWLFAGFTVCIAQEWWLHSKKFHNENGEKLSISFLAGNDFIGRPWLTASRVVDFKLHQISAVSDLLDSIKSDSENGLNYTAKSDGTQLFSLKSTNLLQQFSADTFNMILKAYELDAVQNQRQKGNAGNSPARVNRQLFAKLIVQVGGKRDEVYRKVLGWPVEIIPDRNPTSLKVGDQIKFKILFDGKPVFGVRAKVWNRFDNRTTLQNIYTQQDGTIEARISSPGPWMVTVVTMAPSKDPDAEWQSYLGSLVFGFD